MRVASWRDRILREFTPHVSRLTLVADPDGLLTEEGVLDGIRIRGFELIPFDDHIAFRYAYESKYRSHWDRGEQTELVVVLRAECDDLDGLPFDLLQAGRKLSFSIGRLFPNLSYPVVSALDRSEFEALYRAQLDQKPGRMGDNATRDFVLHHVFGITPELIRTPADLLQVLLRRHYQNQHLPPTLDERLLQVLQQADGFRDWPLALLLKDRQSFIAFLQERWSVFLDRHLGLGAGLKPGRSVERKLRIPGPAEIPFDHEAVRVYVDNLFQEGILKPVAHSTAEPVQERWVATGILTTQDENDTQRLAALLESIGSDVPAVDARHQDWLRFAPRWAQLIALRHRPRMKLDEHLVARFSELEQAVDSAFLAWVGSRYAGLHNLPASPPAMVHHIPRAMAAALESDRPRRMALVVMDGMAFDQWVVLAEALRSQNPSMKLNEDAVFAWLPTITAVSRQALFAGRCPFYFPYSINTTSKDEEHWRQFWIDQGLDEHEIVHARLLQDTRDFPGLEAVLSNPAVRVLGVVLDKVDRISHGMQLGTAGMHNQVRQWAEQGVLSRLLNLLLKRGFDVYITSDHGNIEARGCGRVTEGALADVRGQRVRVYPTSSLRAQVAARAPGAIEWPAIGLPADYLPLLAPDRSAFITDGENVVTHGGISLEELVVPLALVESECT